MKRGRGMQGREERSKGIEIRIADAFAIINELEEFFFLAFFFFSKYTTLHGNKAG
jgi:hypothetical protein